MTQIEYALWMASLNLIPSKKYQMYQEFKSIEAIYKASREELLTIQDFNLLDIYELESSKEKFQAHQSLAYLQKNEIKLLTIEDSHYPTKLKSIYDPPLVLFMKGNEMLLQKRAIAIVGSRLADEYGKKIAYEMAKDISNKDVCVVSGLALGIDSMAHLGAMRRIGGTIAVIGTGLDLVYPKENENLSREVIRNGLIMTEFPLGTKPVASNFPMRNRMISALSEGVLVVEAKERSGALITVDFALEQGKTVYVIPGNIDNPLCVGCNNLIKEGAKVVTSTNDILEDYGY